MKKRLANLCLIVFAVILFCSGAINLKNYQKEFSFLDISYGSFLEPLMWMILIALGIHLGVNYFKYRFRS